MILQLATPTYDVARFQLLHALSIGSQCRIVGMSSLAKVSFFRSETSWNEILYDAHTARVRIK